MEPTGENCVLARRGDAIKNADEFKTAIENNASIYPEPGTYDLTKWLQSDNRLSTDPQYNLCRGL